MSAAGYAVIFSPPKINTVTKVTDTVRIYEKKDDFKKFQEVLSKLRLCVVTKLDTNINNVTNNGTVQFYF